MVAKKSEYLGKSILNNLMNGFTALTMSTVTRAHAEMQKWVKQINLNFPNSSNLSGKFNCPGCTGINPAFFTIKKNLLDFM